MSRRLLILAAIALLTTACAAAGVSSGTLVRGISIGTVHVQKMSSGSSQTASSVSSREIRAAATTGAVRGVTTAVAPAARAKALSGRSENNSTSSDRCSGGRLSSGARALPMCPPE
jgi:hypothetical protein